jgi:hypothetical protein
MKTARLRVLPIAARPAPIVDRTADLVIALVATLAVMAATALLLQVLNG